MLRFLFGTNIRQASLVYYTHIFISGFPAQDGKSDELRNNPGA
jgi:hypothetical protein